MSMITADPKDVPHVAEFAFDAEHLAKAKELIANYPAGRQASAVIGVLDLAQRQQGWLPRVAMDEVAKLLDMAPIRVYEIATFYTMFQLKPKGRYLLQVCTTTPCWLRGSDEVMKACQHAADGEIFSVQEVECLCACVNAPVVQINDDFYEDLDPASLKKVLDAFRRGEVPKPGPQVDRQASAPEGGPTTLRSE
ncbi:NAD(P)H-dependent oxidoreductase subunit E [soil metagenome]